MDYQTFKNGVLGQVIGDGQCVALVVNNSRAYSEFLFPGVSWTSIFAPVAGARQLLGDANAQYFIAIANDHNDPSQVPQQGDVMVFDATPQAGYTNTYDNPYGHTGICESADANGYNLLQQNSPTNGAPVNVHYYPWDYRPCLGWLRPVTTTAPAPPPAPQDAPAPAAPPTPEVTTVAVPSTPAVIDTPTPTPAPVLPNLVNNIATSPAVVTNTTPSPTPVVTPTILPSPSPVPIVVHTSRKNPIVRFITWLIHKIWKG